MTRPPWLTNGIFALLALALALFMLLAAELLPSGPAASAPAALAVPAATPAQAADAAVGQWATTILARPLFNASRRPVQVAVSDMDVSLPRLSAIIVNGGVRSAVFDDGGPKPLVLTAGGEIGAYRLETIAPDNVNLLGPDGQVTLRPQFTTGAAATPGN
jgi:hypothetical protein